MPAIALLLAGASPLAAATLITNARIIDGSGAPARAGSVRIEGDRIAAVGRLKPLKTDTIVDAHGLTLTPGFIDSHSHHDGDGFKDRSATPLLAQGVTTIVVGNDGFNAVPLAELQRQLVARPIGINVASYTGHGNLRATAMGLAAKQPANEVDMAKMAALLQADLAAGSLGLSTGLEYEPAIYSAPSEVLGLAKVAAAAGGRYISHMRSEDLKLDAAIDELLEIGRVTGMPVQISHFKIALIDRWGQASQVLARLDKARAAGIDVTADVYPYEYWQSTLAVLLPKRDYNDLEAAKFALTRLSTPEGMRLNTYAPEPALAGKTIAEIAVARHADPYATYLELIRTAQAYRLAHPVSSGAPAVESVIGTSMAAADVADFIAWPQSNICSDGSPAGLHPRNYGSFAKILRLYVREQHRLTLAEAVHKMTGLAADHMGFADRGRIRPGAYADLALFDPAMVSDRSTVEHPELLATGMDRVWTNGALVYAAGKATSLYPGRFLKRASSVAFKPVATSPLAAAAIRRQG
jgi:N-acyl-D-amino-acid deacylase